MSVKDFETDHPRENQCSQKKIRKNNREIKYVLTYDNQINHYTEFDLSFQVLLTH